MTRKELKITCFKDEIFNTNLIYILRIQLINLYILKGNSSETIQTSVLFEKKLFRYKHSLYNHAAKQKVETFLSNWCTMNECSRFNEFYAAESERNIVVIF